MAHILKLSKLIPVKPDSVIVAMELSPTDHSVHSITEGMLIMTDGVFENMVGFPCPCCGRNPIKIYFRSDGTVMDCRGRPIDPMIGSVCKECLAAIEGDDNSLRTYQSIVDTYLETIAKGWEDLYGFV